MLVIVKDWDIQQLLEPGLDFKTAGRTDVLEIYAAEGGSDVYHSADDFLSILCVKTDGKRIDAAKFPE